jgi:hypothetical protein
LLTWVDRHRWWLFALVLVAYMVGFNGQWRPGPDSSLYVTLGRNTAEGLGYTLYGSPHDHVYPGLPMLIAEALRISPAHGMLVVHVVIWLMVLGGLGLSYLLLRMYVSRGSAVAITVAVALSLTMYRYAFQVLTEGPFFFGLMLAMLGYVMVIGRSSTNLEGRTARTPPLAPNRSLMKITGWVALWVGLAVVVVTRPAMLAIGLAFAAAVVWHLIVGPRRVSHLAIGLIGILLVGFFIWFDPRQQGEALTLGRYERSVVSTVTNDAVTFAHHLWDNLLYLLNPITAEAFFGIEFGPVVTSIISLLILMLGLSLVMRWPLAGLVIAMNLVMMVMTTTEKRYFMPILPLLALGWWVAIVRWLRTLPAGSAGWLLLVILPLWLGPNVVRVAGFALEQRQGDFERTMKEGQYAGVLDLSEAIRKHAPADAVLFCNEGDTSKVVARLADRPVAPMNQLTVEGLHELLMADRQPLLLWVGDAAMVAAAIPVPVGFDVGQPLLRIDPGPGLQPWSLLPVHEAPAPVNDEPDDRIDDQGP